MEDNVIMNIENTDQNIQNENVFNQEVSNILEDDKSILTQSINTENTENIAENVKKIENNEEKTDNSLNLGKFKDVSSLLNAYNNLQAEFTKKCQKLSELTKTCDNNVCALPQDNWREKVDFFLANNQEAKPYAKEISETLMNNTELYNSENGLEKAWTKVLLDNVLSLKQKMQDKSFVSELINSDNNLKQNIIDDYVSTLKAKQSPNLMDKAGSAFAISKTDKALNLEDASQLVRAMFK